MSPMPCERSTPSSQTPRLPERDLYPAGRRESSPSLLVTKPLNLRRSSEVQPRPVGFHESSPPLPATRPLHRRVAASGNDGRVSSPSTRFSLPPPALHEPLPTGLTRRSLQLPTAAEPHPVGFCESSPSLHVVTPLHPAGADRVNDSWVSSSCAWPSHLLPGSPDPHRAGFHELPPPADVTRPLNQSGTAATNVGQVSSYPPRVRAPPPPAPVLLSEALARIRRYEPDQARELLAAIEHPSPELEAQIRDAHEVIGAITCAESTIKFAQETEDWRGILRAVASFEADMHFSSNGMPRRGFTFPLPKMFLFSACEAHAYLGRVEPAQRSLNELIANSQLTQVEQTWLMGLIAYVSGNVATSLSLLNSIALPTESARIRSLRNRASTVQKMLNDLNNFDFTSQRERVSYVGIESNFLLDHSHLLLDQCVKRHIHQLYKEKLEAATPRRRPGLGHRLAMRLRSRRRTFATRKNSPPSHPPE